MCMLSRMDPATTVAGAAAGSAAAYLAIGVLADGARRMAGWRLPALPSARRWAAGLAVLAVLARTAPAGAALPPPPMRLEAVRPEPAAGAAVRARAAVPAATVTHAEPRPGTAYVVQRGDSLWAIASRALEAERGVRPPSAEVAAYWKRIYGANRQVVGADPDLIFPGQRLALPEVA